MSRNIELKARCADLLAAARVAERLGATLLGVERQHDTYFPAANGRLKLRRRSLDGREQPSELIWYERPNESHARASDYSIVTSNQGEPLRLQLAGALGIAVEVVKQRTVYWYDHVRIHLDSVESLGSFVEFEAIVDESCTDAVAHAKLDRLRTAFVIAPDQIVAGSYADLDPTAGA